MLDGNFCVTAMDLTERFEIKYALLFVLRSFGRLNFCMFLRVLNDLGVLNVSSILNISSISNVSKILNDSSILRILNVSSILKFSSISCVLSTLAV